MPKFTVKLVRTPILGWTAARSEDEVTLYPFLLHTEHAEYQETGVKVQDFLGIIPAMPGQKHVKLVLNVNDEPATINRRNQFGVVERQAVECSIGIETATHAEDWEEYRAEAENDPASYFSWYFPNGAQYA